MILDDSFDNCQSDTGTIRDTFGCRQPLKNLKYLLEVLLLNADAVVSNEECIPAVCFLYSNIDAGRRVVFSHVFH